MTLLEDPREAGKRGYKNLSDLARAVARGRLEILGARPQPTRAEDRVRAGTELSSPPERYIRRASTARAACPRPFTRPRPEAALAVDACASTGFSTRTRRRDAVDDRSREPPRLSPRRVAPARGATRSRRGRAARVVRVDAGVKYKRDEVEVNRQIGEGSFGIVYQGKIDKRKAGDVVLKRPKLTVEGAAELQEVEAWMNDRVSRDARGACADFLGSFRVTPDEAYLNASEGVIDKEGLWLVWKYEGDRTLAQYMAQPDYPMGIANALLGREGNVRGDAVVELEVTQAAIRQVFKNLASVHRARIAHRDIKPHNLVLTDNGPRGEV